ncbi:isochorismatase [Bacillus sp. SA1-12]|uniref:isochorismatase family cysteine hydrolase n=1 Tax=Bacillus sp. SA1-12 TaxID=1455638 RepID=UPI0006273175|nr:isochorismatase family cysteine hydrolase [Bacillus sp. SA1-12]KKI89402.1 isochorismatase [Bacillus sp. SA1-12]
MEELSINDTLNGSVPDFSFTTLLIIDVFNDMNFEGGRELAKNALPMAKRLRVLKEKFKRKGIPVIYINDNYGKWTSERAQIVKASLRKESTGREVAELLIPDKDDYFIIKPKHSGFFSTTLETLLASLKAQRLILTGLQTDICVLFTANDAYMRNYQICIPEDCAASEKIDDHTYALEKMKRLLKADTTPSTKLDLENLIQPSPSDQHLQRY